MLRRACSPPRACCTEEFQLAQGDFEQLGCAGRNMRLWCHRPHVYHGASRCRQVSRLGSAGLLCCSLVGSLLHQFPALPLRTLAVMAEQLHAPPLLRLGCGWPLGKRWRWKLMQAPRHARCPPRPSRQPTRYHSGPRLAEPGRLKENCSQSC